MPLLDTRLKQDLIGNLISDIVLQLLSYVAQTEREFIHQRQAEGIAAARAKGVKFGRSSMPPPPAFFSIYRQWKGELFSARQAARYLQVSPTTFLKWAKQVEKGEWEGKRKGKIGCKI